MTLSAHSSIDKLTGSYDESPEFYSEIEKRTPGRSKVHTLANSPVVTPNKFYSKTPSPIFDLQQASFKELREPANYVPSAFSPVALARNVPAAPDGSAKPFWQNSAGINEAESQPNKKQTGISSRAKLDQFLMDLIPYSRCKL